MASSLLIRQGLGRNFAVAYKLRASPLPVAVGITRASTLAACRVAGSGYTLKPINNSAPLNLHHELFSKHYYSTSPGKLAAKWLRKQLLVLFAIAGVTGGALLVFYGQMRSAVDQLSWVERLYPSNMAKGVAGSLESFSDWLKSSSKQQSSPESSIPPTKSIYASDRHMGSDTSKDRLLTSEIAELQARVQALLKDNHELRQALSKMTGGDLSRFRSGQKQTLIEMYTDVLNLLSEFDAKSSRKDKKFINTLPQVVVVGDQSAGKTSVLEMVANARIFPRGGGEMMTRSPVMVTLSEGSQHVAQFHDSHKVYNLENEKDLESLRNEIEKRMKSSVQPGKTVSTQPISLVVRGPQLKRMVLVDLPGIISTVTSGMAATTREEILKMCRQYMQNPNAIVMCIQDGSVDAERSMVTDLANQMDPEGQRTIFVLTKVDMAEKGGIKQDRMTSILDGRLFPMKALGYFAVVTGKGNTGDAISEIQKYEREYFAKSKLFQNGMLRESQLSTRNMVNAVTSEFWKMVNESVHDQALQFKTLRYNLEAEWRNRYPGGRTLDRDDLFELGKADILNKVAGLQMREPAKWESLLMTTLWSKVAPRVMDIFKEAAQGRSAGEFNTSVDIELHKWAESLQLAQLCANVGMDTMFDDLHSSLEHNDEAKNRFHTLSQGLREEVERLSRKGHQWESYNVDQLKYVQMSALDDKDVPSADQWRAAVQYMTEALRTQKEEAEEALVKIEGPTSFYDRYIRWQGQTEQQAKQKAIADELSKFLSAEPGHPSKLYTDEILTIQRVLKTKGYAVTEDDVSYTWKYVYDLHFLKQAEQTAQKCQRGYNLRKHSPEYACPEVEYFWRVKQVMKSSAHTLRVQILDREVRQLEQQVKSILDAIAIDESRKNELIRGDAVDKAEQLKQVRLIQEKLDAFKEALSKQQKRRGP